MTPTQKLHDLGQSLWLDNITRGLLTSGGLEQLIRDLSLTGLTSNPTIFDHAMRNSSDYDGAIREKTEAGRSGEDLFFDLAIEDLRQAANLFRSVHSRTNGVDGWVSLELSPQLASNTAGSIEAAKNLHARADRPNLFIKIPGTKQGLGAIEDSIFAGVPINVTLLFSRDQYIASAEAYLRGVERRIAAGLNPDVPSVASLFISRWDVAVKDKAPGELRNRLGIAVAEQTYASYRELLDSPRIHRILNEGGRPQRLLWASTGTKNPEASDVLYAEALVAPFTINTAPEATLKAMADHGNLKTTMAVDGGDSASKLKEFAAAGIDLDALADQLQTEGTDSFMKSWKDLLDCIATKSQELQSVR